MRSAPAAAPGESSSATPARAAWQRQRRLRRREQRGGALSTGRMRDFDEIATTRWRSGEIVRKRMKQRRKAVRHIGSARSALIAMSGGPRRAHEVEVMANEAASEMMADTDGGSTLELSGGS
ncbi:hypothetical protein Scep_007898 [Stephania cephalantha]|uniref:Uncharacterized protein n=1 Tax=Stephania cephalantha TaxID=152367 RepID=A0AAP0PQG9_9MAGN